MCGRYTITPTLDQIIAGFGGTLSTLERTAPVTERYNVAPTQDVLAVVAGRDGEGPRAMTLRWGLIPHWVPDPSGEPLRINARAETLTERPAFRDLVASERGRCLVVADGFYEWIRAEDAGQPRRPLHFSLAGRAPFAFAGLWTRWRGEGDQRVASCTIITTEANRVVAPAHDRMPVILADPAEQAAWLDPTLDAAGVAPLLRPLEGGLLHAQRASARVNAARHDAPDCLVDDDPVQLSLL
jgi:putative SOS response-associated peptidase YedK